MCARNSVVRVRLYFSFGHSAREGKPHLHMIVVFLLICPLFAPSFFPLTASQNGFDSEFRNPAKPLL